MNDYPLPSARNVTPVTSGGIGILAYELRRDGVFVGAATLPSFTDNTVQPGTTYVYWINAIDYHGNRSAVPQVTITTPPAGAIDPRRVGVSSTGAYWGGGGEQIDMRTGNLNYSIPLVTALGRAGWKVPVGISYNSQNWRQDGGVNWHLGEDVGVGYGWKMQIGSITPYFAGFAGGVDHYVFSDGTGAEYRLDVSNNGIWSSTQGIYAWFDANANILHFKDGTFWVMGCTSGGTEADAGTLYPTIIEDVSGNQVLVTYDTGLNLPFSPSAGTPNTSSRLVKIEDVRAVQCWISCINPGSYLFTYDNPYSRALAQPPHLTTIANTFGGGEAWTFTYDAQPTQLAPPFGADPGYTAQTTVTHLLSVKPPVGTYTFQYDPAGAGELTRVTLPAGGHLGWTYSTDSYNGSRNLRAVTTRLLSSDWNGGNELSYPITRDNASGATVHTSATLADASGAGAKTWKFSAGGGSTPAWQVGLASEFIQSASSGGAVYSDDTYVWSQNPSLTPYISATTTVTDPGSSPQSAKRTQTQDSYGNVTQAVVYPYNSTTPLRTYDSTFETRTDYVANYVRDRLLTTKLKLGTSPDQTTLVTNTYGSGYSGGSNPPMYEFDAHPPVPVASRGYPATTVTLSKTLTYGVDQRTGAVSAVGGSDGSLVQIATSAALNYAAPVSIATQSYSQSIAYASWQGPSQVTGLNGEQLSMTYDSWGRPASASSPYGGGWSYTYGSSLPLWQQTGGPDGITKTTMDGLGRGIKVERGSTGVVDTVYGPCACSPLGKLQKMSAPHAPGVTAAWTVYTYDGIGRTLGVTQPDGVSTTTSSYSGNQTTVTDPLGKWKRFTSDVDGNLLTVVEPDPANTPNGTVTTSYGYDWMGHLTAVTMARASGTQSRTFVYDSAGRLTSATNPENGTVGYFYNADNTLQYKHDAKGNDTVYTYDWKKRVTMVQQFPAGRNSYEDNGSRVTYTYDANAVNPDFSQSTQGRLATAQYGLYAPGHAANVTEMYSYHPAGAVTKKQLLTDRCGPDQNEVTVCAAAEVDYTYDAYGRVQTYFTTPNSTNNGDPAQPDTFTYTYDTYGAASLTEAPLYNTDGVQVRPPLTWVKNLQHDAAGRMTSIDTFAGTGPFSSGYEAGNLSYTTETRGFTVNGQMASQNWSTLSAWDGVTRAIGSLQYFTGLDASLSPTNGGAANGQIAAMVDGVSKETVLYQYDALKRLVAATSTPNAGSAVQSWAQSYQYDGFGNLTAKTLQTGAGAAVTTAIPVNVSTNRLTNASYDANGNMTSGSGVTMGYDEANRIASVMPTSGGAEYYGYAPDNKRVYRLNPATGVEELTLYGARGEKLAKFSVNGNTMSPAGAFVWFGGKMVGPGMAQQDRLGTNRGGGRFYPYGEQIGSATGTDGVQFATYRRDGVSGLDYADQRFYASTLGRFATPDPGASKAAKSDNPTSWNQYAYVKGDAVNLNDPSGLFDQSGNPSYCDVYPGDPECVTPTPIAPQPASASSTGRYTWSLSVGFTPTIDLSGSRNAYDHLFIWVHRSDDSNADDDGLVFDGGPTGNCKTVPPRCGNTTAWDTHYGHYNEILNPQAHEFFTLQLGDADNAYAAQVLAKLIQDTALIAGSSARHRYNPFTGSNSNSVVYSELKDLGITVPIFSTSLPLLGSVGVLTYIVDGQPHLFSGWGQNLLP